MLAPGPPLGWGSQQDIRVGLTFVADESGGVALEACGSFWALEREQGCISSVNTASSYGHEPLDSEVKVILSWVPAALLTLRNELLRAL